jgi:lipoprotein-anchoring transpeptidase ErfK/SrfK
MKKTVWALAVTAVLCAAPAMASSIVARIDLSEQMMRVYINGAQRYAWPVSTARRGYVTPTGTFHPQRLVPMWYSRKYHMSPMPHSIFFLGGFAIHGTYSTRYLGRPASHGCVRLHPSNAATLYSLVSQSRGSTTIVVTR